MPATVAIVGEVASAPLLQYSAGDGPRTRFDVALDGGDRRRGAGTWAGRDTALASVSVWGAQAEHVAESLEVGTRAVILGTVSARLPSSAAATSGGSAPARLEVDAEVVAVSLQHATVPARGAHGPRPWVAQTRPAQRGRQARVEPDPDYGGMLMTVEDVAVLWFGEVGEGGSASTNCQRIRRLIPHALPARRIGNRWYVHRAAATDWAADTDPASVLSHPATRPARDSTK